MNFIRRYSAKDNMVDLINENYDILPVLSRFSIPLGFENMRIDEVCKGAGIDTNVFLFIVNFILTGQIDSEKIGLISPIDIVNFLHNSHEYYLEYKLPHIRQNLLNALDEHHSDINIAIIKFFDSYITQVQEHFKYEEEVAFPYIKDLLYGATSEYSIDVFKNNHNDIDEKLSDLKNIILRYYTTSVPNRMYDVLVDIYNCEDDLTRHTDIENQILIPMISQIEKQKMGDGK